MLILCQDKLLNSWVVNEVFLFDELIISALHNEGLLNILFLNFAIILLMMISAIIIHAEIRLLMILKVVKLS
jgi:hypothetical protein